MSDGHWDMCRLPIQRVGGLRLRGADSHPNKKSKRRLEATGWGHRHIIRKMQRCNPEATMLDTPHHQAGPPAQGESAWLPASQSEGFDKYQHYVNHLLRMYSGHMSTQQPLPSKYQISFGRMELISPVRSLEAGLDGPTPYEDTHPSFIDIRKLQAGDKVSIFTCIKGHNPSLSNTEIVQKKCVHIRAETIRRYTNKMIDTKRNWQLFDDQIVIFQAKMQMQKYAELVLFFVMCGLDFGLTKKAN